MHTKVNIFNPYILAASIVVGIFCSLMVGIANWNQSKANYDDLAKIKSVKSRLDASITCAENIKPVGEDLSEYNKKVANSKMLSGLDQETLSKISDEYLKSLKAGSKETSARFFAVREYGRIISVMIGIVSLFVTVPAIWLIISAVCAFVDARLNGGAA